jgi:hypothetical protein
MTDLAIREDNSNGVARAMEMPPGRRMPVDAPAPSALMVWAQEAQQAAQIANSLAKTSFVPASLRGKPADVTAAILAGQELGLQPMASLRSMDVIQGTPALRAHAMRGLVQSHGHEIELVESTDERCVMRGRRKGSDRWQTVEWDQARAGKLGLLSKDQWKKQPKTMLIARATGEICRLVAADVLYAMPYAAEELDGYDSGPVAHSPQVTAAEITGQSAADPHVWQEVETVEPGPAPVEATASMASEEQRERIAALWKQLGYGGDENHAQRMQISAKVLGLLEVPESSDELTAEEADRLIGVLAERVGVAPGGEQ